MITWTFQIDKYHFFYDDGVLYLTEGLGEGMEVNQEHFAHYIAQYYKDNF